MIFAIVHFDPQKMFCKDLEAKISPTTNIHKYFYKDFHTSILCVLITQLIARKTCEKEIHILTSRYLLDLYGNQESFMLAIYFLKNIVTSIWTQPKNGYYLGKHLHTCKSPRGQGRSVLRKKYMHVYTQQWGKCSDQQKW